MSVVARAVDKKQSVFLLPRRHISFPPVSFKSSYI